MPYPHAVSNGKFVQKKSKYKTMKKLFLFIALTGTLFSLYAFKKTTEEQIIGSWKHENISTHKITFGSSSDRSVATNYVNGQVIPRMNNEMDYRFLEFRKGGVGAFTDGAHINNSFSYSIDGKILTVTFSGETPMSGSYSISGNKLNWTPNSELLQTDVQKNNLEYLGVASLRIRWTLKK
jgi:hypothetical protein